MKGKRLDEKTPKERVPVIGPVSKLKLGWWNWMARLRKQSRKFRREASNVTIRSKKEAVARILELQEMLAGGINDNQDAPTGQAKLRLETEIVQLKAEFNITANDMEKGIKQAGAKA